MEKDTVDNINVNLENKAKYEEPTTSKKDKKMGKVEMNKASSNTTQKSQSNPYHMTQELLILKYAKIDKGRYITQLFAGITACASSLSHGQVLGWCYPALRKKYNRELLNMTIADSAALKVKGTHWESVKVNFKQTASFIALGCIFGNIILSYLSMRKGPRKVMIVLCPFMVLGWIIFALIHDQDFRAFAMLWLSFISIGFKICGETLLRDTVHAANLYHLFVLFRSATNFGVMIGYIFGSLYETNVGYSSSSSILCIFQFIMICICKESPVHTFERNPTNAEKALQWYRGHGNTYAEMRFIKKDSDMRHADVSARYMLFKRAVYKAVLLVAGLTFFEVFTGYYPLMLYSYAVWGSHNDAKLVVISTFWDACILGTTYYLSSLIFGFINYKMPFGVRKPMIITSILIFLILTALSTFLYFLSIEINESKHSFSRNNDWIRLVLTCMFIICYEAGYSTYPDILLTDYLPYQVLPICRLCIRSFRYLLCYILVRFFLDMQRNIPGPGHLYILSIINFIGIFYVAFAIIEPKGRTLLQLQILFGGNPIGNRRAFGSIANYAAKATLTSS